MFQYYGLTRDTFSRSMHTSTSMMQNHSFAVCICILNLLAVELTCHTVVYTLRWKSKCSNNWTAWDSTLVTVSVASTHSRTRDYSNTSLYGAYVCISDLISEVRVENIRMHRLILLDPYAHTSVFICLTDANTMVGTRIGQSIQCDIHCTSAGEETIHI